MSSYLRPVYCARTDPGRQRDHNEDAVYAGPVAEAPAYLLAVADGVGGNERGEWASQTSIDVLKREVQRGFAEATPVDALAAGFRAANDAVWEGGASVPKPQRPASTLVAALVNEGTLSWAHVGDSRAYLLRQGRVQRLTQDHSWIDEQVRAGFLSREEALLSERRHAITRSIGYDASILVDTGGPMPLRSGDVIVLCSDGLHDLVSDDELGGVVQQLLPEAAAERLVALCNERGGHDNISVVLCSMFDASADDAAQKRHPAEAAVTLP